MWHSGSEPEHKFFKVLHVSFGFLTIFADTALYWEETLVLVLYRVSRFYAESLTLLSKLLPFSKSLRLIVFLVYLLLSLDDMLT